MKKGKVCQETWKDKKDSFNGRGRSEGTEAGEKTNKDRCCCDMTHINCQQVLECTLALNKHAIIWKRARV